MTGWISTLGRKLYLVVILLVSMASAGARNDLVWNYVNLPANGSTGRTIPLGARVTNRGDTPWAGNHYLEIAERDGSYVGYVKLGPTAAGEAHTADFALKLPAVPGTYTYLFRALEHGREYFGPAIARSIAVHPPPLEVTLAIDDSAILAGQSTRVRSVAGPKGQVVAHGLEARALGGHWQKWAEWSDRSADQQVAFPTPALAGIYELRAYAARRDEEPSHSSRAFLTVGVIAPAITSQPASAIASVGSHLAFAVAATGTDPAYQWFKDGVAVKGATDAALYFSPARVAQSGTYAVVVANSGGTVTSRPATLAISPLALPALAVDVARFPSARNRRAVAPSAAQVGDVVSVNSFSNVTAGGGWRHNILVRRPAITEATAIPPEDGSGLPSAHEAWNKDGWGNPHTDGASFNAELAGRAAADLGNREPFIHTLIAGQPGSTRAVDFVLDAPGAWLVRAEVVDLEGELIAASAIATLNVADAALAGDPANITYPYGRSDRFVGVFWNAGQAHRLWSTWRADFQSSYRATWAVNWQLMWQPSPYFRRNDGSWLQPDPPADSPWQPFWSAHQVYALVPDGAGGSRLTHDLTSQAFAEKAALRLMDVGVDFVAVDYTNQFLEEREDVFPAVNNLARAFQSVALQSQSGGRIRLCAVVPANVSSGDWSRNGGFVPAAIARFNAKLTTLYDRFARFEPAWFHLEDDNGARKPLLLLWIGAGGEDDPDGKLSAAKLDQLRLADGRLLADVFTIRWVGAYLANNRRFLNGASYTVQGAEGPVSGGYANATVWSYHESHPATATVMPGGAAGVEAVTVQPVAGNRDRFGRTWNYNWPAEQGYHYETPAAAGPVPLANYGRIWHDALTAARALNPKFLLTTWAEFGSENDEPRPEMSVTIMDNNKFGTHFGDAFREAVRLFKYQAPVAWIDTYAAGEAAEWFSNVSANSLPVFGAGATLRLQGWVTPNVATTFAGGSVNVYVDDRYVGSATVGGSWNGGTRWHCDLAAAALGPGSHAVKVVVEDGAGGAALAGVQFRGEPPRSALPIAVRATSGPPDGDR